MNRSRLSILLAMLLSLHIMTIAGAQPPAPAAPVGTAFTYRGRLRTGATAVTARCDFQFSLWNAASAGSRVGSVLSTNNIQVSDGRFNVTLDFGAAAFDGQGRWLLVAVRCPTGSGGFTSLSPRQALASSPYATRATTAGSVAWASITGKPAGFADDVDNTGGGVPVPLNLTGSSVNPILNVSNNGQPNIPNNNYALAILGISPEGRGIEGQSTRGFGVAGFSATSVGVFGRSDDSNGFGVYATNPASNGTGIYGVANSGSNAYGIWGQSNSGFAGFFSGKVHVQGTLSGSDKQFKIDHPLDPANKYLSHASVESSDMKNIYDGVVTLDSNGAATVTLPDWFEALNQDFRYQLTAIGAPGPDLYIATEVQGNSFAIAGGAPGMKVSWQLTGIRHDPWAERNRMEVETVKSAQQRGTYLYPQGYGKPASMGQDFAKQQQLVQTQPQSQGQSDTP